MSGRVKLTRNGYDTLEKELNFRRGEKRQEILTALTEARAQGDLSENAEYDAAKESQAYNEKRIGELQDILTGSVIIDNEDIDASKALLGATVSVKDLGTGDEYDYMLVSEEESDFDLDKISTTSPVGRALLGNEVGDVVDVAIPAGAMQLEIVKISR
jgi:transcription elongation factor GreA